MIKISLLVLVFLFINSMQGRSNLRPEEIRNLNPEYLAFIGLELKVSKTLTSLYAEQFLGKTTLQSKLSKLKREEPEVFLKNQRKDLLTEAQVITAIKKLASAEFHNLVEENTNSFLSQLKQIGLDHFHQVLTNDIKTDKAYFANLHHKILVEITPYLLDKVDKLTTHSILPIGLRREDYPQTVNDLRQHIRQVHIQLGLQSILVKFLLVADLYNQFNGIISSQYTDDISKVIIDIKEDLNQENEEFIKSIVAPAVNELLGKKTLRNHFSYFDFFNRNVVNLALALENPLRNILVKEVMTNSVTTPGHNIRSELYGDKFCTFIEKHFTMKSLFQIKTNEEVEQERQALEEKIKDKEVGIQIDSRNRFEAKHGANAKLHKLEMQKAVEFDMWACHPDLIFEKSFSDADLTVLFRLHTNPNNSLFFLKLWKYFQSEQMVGQEFYQSKFDPIYIHLYKYYLESRHSARDNIYDQNEWVSNMKEYYYKGFSSNEEEAQFIYMGSLLTLVLYNTKLPFYYAQYSAHDQDYIWYKLFCENDHFLMDLRRIPQNFLPKKIKIRRPNLNLVIPQVGQITEQELAVFSNPDTAIIIRSKLAQGQKFIKMTDLDPRFTSNEEVYVAFVNRKSSAYSEKSAKIRN